MYWILPPSRWHSAGDICDRNTSVPPIGLLDGGNTDINPTAIAPSKKLMALLICMCFFLQFRFIVRSAPTVITSIFHVVSSSPAIRHFAIANVASEGISWLASVPSV
ncbi:MAG: hypothetical protein ACRCZS_12905 [Chroococcidiopsis sp.]